MSDVEESRFLASESAGEVSALLTRPRGARALLALAHGAGADMRHAFMEAITERLADRDIAVLRYQFPYTEQGKRRPSPRPWLLATVRAALAHASERCGGLPLLAGGKSMGGRMTSLLLSEEAIPTVRGVVFLGFPLHAAGKPSVERGDHLAGVTAPMLFLQGTRDGLADLALLRPICRDLGERAVLHVVEGGDHSFHVLKRSGRTDAEVLDELADAVADFAGKLA